MAEEVKMQSAEQNTLSDLSGRLEGDELYSSEEAAKELLRALDKVGGHLMIFESSYWGKECFGPDHWVQIVYAEVAVETDKAYKLTNAFHGQKVLSILRSRRQAEREIKAHWNDSDPEKDSLDIGFWNMQMEEAKTELNTLRSRKLDGGELGSGWVPKSKVIFEAYSEGPQDYVIFTEAGRKRGRRDDAECTIESTTIQDTRYGRYNKLAIDIPYDEDKDPKDYFDWEEHHFTAKYDRSNNFECWTADTDPREIAEILAQHYEGCAVHEKVLENHDG